MHDKLHKVYGRRGPQAEHPPGCLLQQERGDLRAPPARGSAGTARADRRFRRDRPFRFRARHRHGNRDSDPSDPGILPCSHLCQRSFRGHAGIRKDPLPLCDHGTRRCGRPRLGGCEHRGHLHQRLLPEHHRQAQDLHEPPANAPARGPPQAEIQFNQAPGSTDWPEMDQTVSESDDTWN